MIYETFSPAKPLSDFITHFTYFRHYTPHHSIDRFLPNGNIEIVIDLTNEPKFIYDNISLKEIQACNNIWVSGIRNKFITIPSGKHSEMFVINFAKGMVRPFLGMPLTEITDTVVDGDIILEHGFLELRERLLETENIVEKFKLAEQLLTRQFSNKLFVHPCIQYAVQKIVAAPEINAISDIKNKSGYSSKHLIDLFKTQVGVTPKAFLRIIRFQKAVHDIEISRHINWASLALGCGYYDQAHFISDFKAYAGFTPADYIKRKNSTLNYVPVG